MKKLTINNKGLQISMYSIILISLKTCIGVQKTIPGNFNKMLIAVIFGRL